MKLAAEIVFIVIVFAIPLVIVFAVFVWAARKDGEDLKHFTAATPFCQTVAQTHGQVFADSDRNSIENGAEAGVVGWTVTLLDPANRVLATTTTEGRHPCPASEGSTTSA